MGKWDGRGGREPVGACEFPLQGFSFHAEDRTPVDGLGLLSRAKDANALDLHALLSKACRIHAHHILKNISRTLISSSVPGAFREEDVSLRKGQSRFEKGMGTIK